MKFNIVQNYSFPGEEKYKNWPDTFTILKSIEDCDDICIIPEGVQAVENFVFMGCDNLKKVVFPEGFIAPLEGAFDECNSLDVVTFHEGSLMLETAFPFRFIDVGKFEMIKKDGSVEELSVDEVLIWDGELFEEA